MRFLNSKLLVPKERLVLGMIDYDKVAVEEWSKSSFLAKNARLLLVLYLFERQKATLDYVIRFVTLWEFPEEDLRIIRRDWDYILAKIRADAADELSEGDTLYLGACTKGADSSQRRKVRSGKLVKPRAFALKQGYMRYVLHKHILKLPTPSEPFLKTKRQKQKAATFEEQVCSRFSVHFGKTAKEIATELAVTLDSRAKGFHASITRAILGVSAEQVAEFEKAEIVSRTMRTRPDGLPAEHVSFPAFKPLELVKQRWEDSDLRNLLIRRFFFVIYRRPTPDSDPTLSKVAFWSMPAKDREFDVRAVWEKAVAALKSAHPEDLPKIKDSRVAHVRPHGRDSSDTVESIGGLRIVKQCFWLNAAYLREQLHLSPS